MSDVFRSLLSPAGWFQIGWSDDVAPGTIAPLSVFGHELILRRGHSGALAAFDAFCPHLGAHLGHGGCVEGDDIICPFHGWRWSSEGSNTEIPYSERVNLSLSLRSWTIQESDGVVWGWFDPQGAPPGWDPPRIEGLAEGSLQLAGRKSWSGVTAAVSDIAEAAADPPFLGRALGRRPCALTDVSVDGYRLTTSHVLGGPGPSTEELRCELFGLGITVVRSSRHQATYVQTQTPVRPGEVDLRCSVYTDGEPDDAAVEYWTGFLEAGLAVWPHLRYVAEPFLTAEEASVQTFRQWAEASQRKATAWVN